MAQIAVTILDPRGQRSAQLVEMQVPVRDVIPPIVKSLRLPESATYALTPVGSDDALPPDKTLAACRITAGAELRLAPERNRILKAILDKLYEEVEDNVKEQAWDLAKEKLDALLQLDPDYPDPRGLADAIARRLPTIPDAAGGAFTTTARKSPSKLGKAAAQQRSTATSQPADQFRLEDQPGGKSAGKVARKGGGCQSIIGWIAGVVVVGAITVFSGDLMPGLVERVGALFSPDQVVLGTGDVQVTLRWTGTADLDLHVLDPAGSEIWYGSPTAASGGELDVDANAACQEQQARPVENVFWPDGAAPRGEYRVTVDFYQDCDGSGVVDYEVTIKVDRSVLDVINGRVTYADATQTLRTFRY